MFVPIEEALRAYGEEKQSTDELVREIAWQDSSYQPYDYATPSRDVLRESAYAKPVMVDPMAQINHPLLSNEVFNELI